MSQVKTISLIAMFLGVLLLVARTPGGAVPPRIAPPIDADGFYVLAAYESSDVSQPVASIIESGVWRDKVSDLDGKWKRFDLDVDLGNLPPVWAEAAEKARPDAPCFLISNSERGGEILELSDSVKLDDVLDAIDEWGPRE